MSTNGWKPRQTEALECPSGQTAIIRRPGPEFVLRAGKVARTFSQVAQDETEGTEQERGLSVIARMSDEEQNAVMTFARAMVCASVVSPKLYLNPREGQIGPDDIGDDFWFLFSYAMKNFFNLKVPVGDEEVQVSDLETFHGESSVSGDGVDGVDVRSNPEQSVGDQGLARSA